MQILSNMYISMFSYIELYYNDLKKAFIVSTFE